MPRTFKISSRRRRARKASIVALTTLEWLLEPSDVANSDRFDHRADAAAGNHARSGRSRTEENAPTAKLADGFVRNRIFVQGHLFHRFARRFGSFADRLGHFIGFAEADSDFTVVISCDNQRAKAKTPAAF